jgi:uncharacterized membrane protein
VSSDRRVQWLIRILCVLGIGVAGYLAWTHLGDTDPYCGSARGCADVQHSPYSEVMGVPVPVIGLFGYGVLLALSLLRGHVDSEVEFYLPVLSFFAALVGVLYSAYLTYLEALVIHVHYHGNMGPLYLRFVERLDGGVSLRYRFRRRVSSKLDCASKTNAVVSTA